MIRLTEVTEDNWLEAASLTVRDDQKGFVASACGILARGYVYRNCRSRVFVIENEEAIVGLALVRDFTEEPLGYDLQEFMIDKRYQGRGYGCQALGLILDELRADARFDRVEVCVKKDDAAAIHLYGKWGFIDSEYMDEDVPDCVNMVRCLN
ncbi:MAG: GNAT family N-acetyltransferase [Eubacteriaceae bacterium]|nr:GNAT family N-acetyltransferase [Eubacteriaceae bacterium]